ncbi:FAD-dependent thymidylate synthase [Paenibacillus planticolens]|uniref:Flavin-dependent thymidylate synthase n=1 Tax=Paenibacillus planticolens TaxID=2654976 RepID=A0ABX1ZHD7_9BACL|nr:FAD-dependent thymidylate synthase [Paenibacillus planticolens]NOU98459.1 FAD-dependent thymidylate synthase [Paenibacillus planticolens]
MNVKLIAHTALSIDFLSRLPFDLYGEFRDANDRQAVALTAIRTCYSPNAPSEILTLEGAKYFGQSASDGEAGTEADRLFRHIVRSGHASTLEHLTYTFAIEGVSRALLAQLTRHRQFSFSVQSQRYVKFGSGDKAGGFDYVTPKSLGGKYSTANGGATADEVYEDFMGIAQAYYNELRRVGVPAEDARFVLPNAAACNIVMTANLRAILEFYSKRNASTHAQWEIAELAESIRGEIEKVDAWITPYFGVQA